jgi:plastocyanin
MKQQRSILAAMIALMLLATLTPSACVKTLPASSVSQPAPVTSQSQTASVPAGDTMVTGIVFGQPPEDEVWIYQLALIPEVLNIRSGETVTWVCFDTIEYTIMSLDGSFTSPVMTWGSRWSYTFTQAGEYRYRFSEDMDQTVGVIIVS